MRILFFYESIDRRERVTRNRKSCGLSQSEEREPWMASWIVPAGSIRAYLQHYHIDDGRRERI